MRIRSASSSQLCDPGQVTYLPSLSFLICKMGYRANRMRYVCRRSSVSTQRVFKDPAAICTPPLLLLRGTSRLFPPSLWPSSEGARPEPSRIIPGPPSGGCADSGN